MATSSSIRLRPFRATDYGRVMTLWKKTEGIGLNESDTRVAVAAFLKRNPGLSAVATSGGRVVGAILCGHDGRRGYLHHLAVAKGWRRRGLGRSLVAFCLDGLHAAGIPKCNLFLFSDNYSGRTFWKRLGWQVRTDLRLVQKPTAAAGGAERRVRSKPTC